MKNKLLIFSALFFLSIIFLSCVSMDTASTTNPSDSRDLILDGETYSKGFLDTIEITSWCCKDYFGKSSKVLVEVGYLEFTSPPSGEKSRVGFILFDGTNEGIFASYSRDGLDHRWDWGERGDKNRYTFVVGSDGTGYYYDFSTSTDGTAKPRTLYKAYKR